MKEPNEKFLAMLARRKHKKIGRHHEGDAGNDAITFQTSNRLSPPLPVDSHDAPGLHDDGAGSIQSSVLSLATTTAVRKAPTNKGDADQVMVLIETRFARLLHASKCCNKSGDCSPNLKCFQMKVHWKHVKKCRDMKCNVPGCRSSRCVLRHASVLGHASNAHAVSSHRAKRKAWLASNNENRAPQHAELKQGSMQSAFKFKQQAPTAFEFKPVLIKSALKQAPTKSAMKPAPSPVKKKRGV